MKVLVACEYSGAVRDAFIKRGHDAISCDLLPTDVPGPHYQGDVFDIIDQGFDLMIAHPPCTYLTIVGNKWYFHPDDKALPSDQRRPHPRFPNRLQHREEALEFFKRLLECPIPKIAVENPRGIVSTRYKKPAQVIQPWMFGDPYSKATCLWLKNLPPLQATNIVDHGEVTTFKSGKRLAKWYADAIKLPPIERMKVRSATFPGIAQAMASQWSEDLTQFAKAEDSTTTPQS